MLPPDKEPELGPLRPKDEVLRAVMRRGTTLRRHHQLFTRGPVVLAVVTAVAVIVTFSSSGTNRQKVDTTSGGPPSSSTTLVPDGSSSDGTGAGPSGDAGSTAASSTDSPVGSGADGSSSSNDAPSPGFVFGPCVPPGTRNPPSRRSCYEAPDGPKGNYVGADPNARGCVVHNIGGGTTLHSDFFCQYDAIVAGGYATDGPFNLLRIVRNGETIDVDGMDPSTPRCQPLGFIQPGDHVYIDGRNAFNGETVPASGYTTTSVGDTFHC